MIDQARKRGKRHKEEVKEPLAREGHMAIEVI